MAMRLVCGTLTVAILSGCGGSGDGDEASAGTETGDSAQSGVFLDAPVQGLVFESFSGSGVTDEAGRFTYQDGEIVHFSLFGEAIGSALGEAVLPVSAMPNGLDLAILLQSVDTDPDDAVIDVSGVTVPDTVLSDLTAALASGTVADVLTVGVLDTIKQETLASGQTAPYLDTPVTRTEALQHVTNSLGSGVTDSFDLNDTFLISKSAPAGDGGVSYRFGSNGLVDVFGVVNDSASTGEFPWMANADGGFSIDFSASNSMAGVVCDHSVVAVDAGSVDTAFQCTNGDSGLRSFYRPQTLSVAGITGRTYAFESITGTASTMVIDANGVLTFEGNDSAAQVIDSGNGTVLVNYADGKGEELVVLIGSFSDGVFMKLDYDVPSVLDQMHIMVSRDGVIRTTDIYSFVN